MKPVAERPPVFACTQLLTKATRPLTAGERIRIVRGPSRHSQLRSQPDCTFLGLFIRKTDQMTDAQELRSDRSDKRSIGILKINPILFSRGSVRDWAFACVTSDATARRTSSGNIDRSTAW